MHLGPYSEEYTLQSVSCKLTFSVFSIPLHRLQILAGLLFALVLQATPIRAEEIFFRGFHDTYSLDRPEILPGVDPGDRSALAIALVSFHRNSPVTRKKLVLEALSALPDGGAWGKCANLYFDGLSATIRLARLEILAGSSPDSPAALFFAMEKAGADQARWTRAAKSFGPVVQSLAHSRDRMAQSPGSARDVAALIEQMEIPLTDAGYIPFAQEVASGLPDLLDHGGLPLEAAILAQAMQRGRSPLPELQKRIPIYLVHAGDFSAALRFETGRDPGFLRNRSGALHAMDWMILGGENRRALEIHAKNLSDFRGTAGDDPWTGFPLTRGILRARAAGLLYLSGDRKEALELLEGLTKSRSFDLETGYARLVQAQLLFEGNLDLSRQIAEDLTYRAQEKSLYLLEYHATVLEGLALQRQGKDYLAWINFVKARGIIHTHLKTAPTRSLALGSLLASLKLNPGGAWKPLVAELVNEERKTREHRGLQLLKELMPADISPAQWKKALLENLTARKLADDLQSQIAQFLEEPLLHPPGESPGGLSGLDDARFWKRQALLPEAANPPASWQGGGDGLARSALSRSLGEGRVLVLLPAVDEILALFLTKDESGIHLESRIFAPNCLSTERRPECEAALIAIRSWADASSSIYFPAGFAPPMNLASNPAGHGWFAVSRVFLAPEKTEAVPSLTGHACSEAGVDAKSLQPLGLVLRRDGAFLLPTLTRKSNSQPIYLGRLLCRKEELRLWDMDRFLSGPGNRIYVFPESDIVGPMTRLAARTGATLIEYGSTADGQKEALLQGRLPQSGAFRVIRPAH